MYFGASDYFSCCLLLLFRFKLTLFQHVYLFLVIIKKKGREGFKSSCTDIKLYVTTTAKILLLYLKHLLLFIFLYFATILFLVSLCV